MMLRPGLGLLRDHSYRQLFASTTVSQFGVHITVLALPLVAIISLRASPFEVGVLAALEALPVLLFGLPCGAWVDRMSRRAVLIVGDLGRAVVLATVPIAWWAGALTIWQLYLVAFSFGLFTVFFDVAYQSYLPHLVGRANLVEGNSKLESVRALAQVAGPAVGGQLIRVLTGPVALLVTGVAMAASALFVVRIRKPEEIRRRDPGARLLFEIREGLQFVLRHPLLRAIASCAALYNLGTAAYLPMMLLYLERGLDQNAGSIGLVLTVLGAGGILGAVVANRFATLAGQGPTIWISVAFSSPFLLLLPLVAQPGWLLWVAAGGGFVATAGAIVFNVTQVSFRQALTPDHLLGRMNATIRFLVLGMMPLGALLGGALGEWLGVRATLLLVGLGQCLAFLPVLLSPLRSMPTLPTSPDEDVVTRTGGSGG